MGNIRSKLGQDLNSIFTLTHALVSMTYMYKYVALPSLPPTGGCSHEKTMNKNCWLESLSLLNNALNNPAQGFTKTPDTENFFFFLPYMYKPKKPYVCFPHMHSTLILCNSHKCWLKLVQIQCLQHPKSKSTYFIVPHWTAE